MRPCLFAAVLFVSARRSAVAEHVVLRGPGRQVWDGKNAHDPRRPFTVKIAGVPHPITQGLRDFVADDELYIGLSGQRPVTVLATAWSRVTGREYPMAFAFPLGQGRVFHTPLGRDARAIQNPGKAALIRRGCAPGSLSPCGRRE